MRSTNVVRKAFCLMLIAVMLVMTAAPALASAKGSGAYVVTTAVKGDRLRVHASPNGDVIGHLKWGTVVVYKSRKSGWWKVAYNGGTGYVDPFYLTSVTSLPSAKYKAVKKLSVYSKAKSSSTYLGKLKTNKKVTIVAKSNSWVRIRLGGNYGWVSAKYLRRVS